MTLFIQKNKWVGGVVGLWFFNTWKPILGFGVHVSPMRTTYKYVHFRWLTVVVDLGIRGVLSDG